MVNGPMASWKDAVSSHTRVVACTKVKSRMARDTVKVLTNTRMATCTLDSGLTTTSKVMVNSSMQVLHQARKAMSSKENSRTASSTDSDTTFTRSLASNTLVTGKTISGVAMASSSMLLAPC